MAKAKHQAIISIEEYENIQEVLEENINLKKELEKNTVYLERRETYFSGGNVNVQVLARYEGEQAVINKLTENINKLLNRNLWQRIFNTGV